MKVEVVIPAYNEQAIIKETIHAIAAVLEDTPGIDWKITVSDNGSTDNTKKVVEEIQDSRIGIYTASGKGKGRALREAFSRSDASIIGFFDADLSVDPSLLPQTIRMLASGGSDVVIGSRFHPESVVDRGVFRSGSSTLFNFCARVLVGISHADTQCGYKFMNHNGRKVFLMNREDTWFFDLEFLFHSKKERLRISEVPVQWTEFRYPGRKSKLNPFRDGLIAVRSMVRIRFSRYIKE